MMRVCFDYRVAVKLTQRKKRAASQSCSPNALRAKVDRTFNKRFKSGNSCPKNLTTGRVLRVESFFTTSLEKTPLTAASYNIALSHCTHHFNSLLNAALEDAIKILGNTTAQEIASQMNAAGIR